MCHKKNIMKNILLLLIILSVLSCREKVDNTQSKTEKIESVVNLEEITSDYNKWYSYYYYEISLSSNFKPLNEKSELITKDKFLNELTTGKYVPIEVKSDSLSIYKLYSLSPDVNKSISTTIKNTATSAYNFYKMEGVKFPDFEVSSLDGKDYNNESLLGKITILKTWFVACKPCIEEMPELNKLVEKYSDSKNIQFISLALDKKESLQAFLNKKEFKYEVIAEQENLIQDKLNLRAYPTHLIIDEDGNIEKVLNTASELISYLENKQPIKQKKLSLPPPPPAAPIQKSVKNDV